MDCIQQAKPFSELSDNVLVPHQARNREYFRAGECFLE